MELDTSDIPLSNYDKERGLILPTHLTKELSYIAGFINGDGNLYIQNTRKYIIICVGNYKDEKYFYDTTISSLFKNVFNIHVKPKYFGKNTYGIVINPKGLLFFLNKVFDIPIGKKSDKVRIPEIVRSNDKQLKSFILGFADADFSLCLKRRYRTIPYYPTIAGVSNSITMMKEISEYLNKKNIPHYLCLKVSKWDKRFNKFWITNYIHIYGIKNLYKWMSCIGFKNPKFVRIAKEVILES